MSVQGDIERWLAFRRENAPHHYARTPSVSMVKLRDAIISALRADEYLSFEDASDALWLAQDQMIRDARWPPR